MLKISSDQKRFFIALSPYPLSFFANTPFNVLRFMLALKLNRFSWDLRLGFNSLNSDSVSVKYTRLKISMGKEYYACTPV